MKYLFVMNALLLSLSLSAQPHAEKYQKYLTVADSLIGAKDYLEAVKQLVVAEIFAVEKDKPGLQAKVDDCYLQYQLLLEQKSRSIVQLMAAFVRQSELTNPTLAFNLALEACRISALQEATEALHGIVSSPLPTSFNRFYQVEFLGHRGAVNAVAISPDEKYVLTGSDDATAALWSIDGQFITNFEGHTTGVTSVAFSPHDDLVLTGSQDFSARLWNLKGKPMRRFEGHNEAVRAVAFSPANPAYLMTASNDRTAKIWNLNTGALRSTLEGHQGEIVAAAFSPDGKFVLTGSEDNDAKLWVLDTLPRFIKSNNNLRGHSNDMTSLAISADGNYIVTASKDERKSILLWYRADVRTPLDTLSKHSGVVTAAAFSPNGDYLLTGGEDKLIILWDFKSYVEKRKKEDAKTDLKTRQHVDIESVHSFLGHSGAVTSLAVSCDGQWFVSGSMDGTAKLWRIHDETPSFPMGHGDEALSVAMTPKGDKWLSACADGTLKLWDESGLLKQFEKQNGAIKSVVFSPDNRLALSGGADKTLRMWNLSGVNLKTIENPGGEVTAVAWSPDGKYLLGGSADNSARIWDTNGALIATIRNRSKGGEINAVAFSPNSLQVLTGGMNGAVALWDLKGELVRRFTGLGAPVKSVAFSPDGRLVLAAGENSVIMLFDAASGAQLKAFQADPFYGAKAAALTPDGNFILVGLQSWMAKLFDLNGRLLQSFDGHQSQINTVATSEKYLMTGSADGAAKIWVPWYNAGAAAFSPLQRLNYGLEIQPDDYRRVTNPELLMAYADALIQLEIERENAAYEARIDSMYMYLLSKEMFYRMKSQRALELQTRLQELQGMGKNTDRYESIHALLISRMLEDDYYRLQLESNDDIPLLHYGYFLIDQYLETKDTAISHKIINLYDYLFHPDQLERRSLAELMDLRFMLQSETYDDRKLDKLMKLKLLQIDAVLDQPAYFERQLSDVNSFHIRMYADYFEMLQAENPGKDYSEKVKRLYQVFLDQGNLEPEEEFEFYLKFSANARQLESPSLKTYYTEKAAQLWKGLLNPDRWKTSHETRLYSFADYLSREGRNYYSNEEYDIAVKHDSLATSVYEYVLKNYPENPDLKNLAARAYNGLAWHLLFTHKILGKQAPLSTVKACERGWQLDSSLTVLITNWALGLLYSGQYQLAANMYSEWKDRSYENSGGSTARYKVFTDTFLGDLNDLEKAGIKHKDVPKIRAILLGEKGPDKKGGGD
jgi:WD40 repeat protein